jgi:heat shock protein HslJ
MKRPAIALLVMLLVLGLAACDALQRSEQEVLPTEVVGVEEQTPVVAEPAVTEVPPVDEPVPPEQQDTSNLVGTSWEWATVIDSMGQTIVNDPTRYMITFGPENIAAIQADCNAVTATYFADESNLSIELGATTLVACPPDSQDSLFLNSIGRASSYTLEDGELFIEMVGDTGTLIFRPAGSGPVMEVPEEPGEEIGLVGLTWQWTSTTTPVEVITVVEPERYTIQFMDDGTASIQADCNMVVATYEATESALSITLGPSTLVACPPDSQSTQFLAGIAGAAIYFFEGDNLFIDLVADSGTMQFAPLTIADNGEEEIAQDDELTSAEWQWFAVTSPEAMAEVTDPTRYTLTFMEDNSLSIQADCNVVLGTYVAGEDGSLSIMLGASTLAACPPDSQDVEFLGYLANARFYFIEEGNLSIEVAEDETTLQFRAGESAETPDTGEESAVMPGVAPGGLVGPVWQWIELVQPTQTTTIPNPVQYTIQFNADGSANIKADCNQVNASYTTGEAGSLMIVPGASTRAFCPPGSLDQVFIGGLTNAMNYRLEGSNLVIEMLYEAGRLVLTPGQ